MPKIKIDIPLILLAFVNLLPIFGVAYLGWSIFLIFIFYWCESAIMAILNFFKILMANPKAKFSKERMEVLRKVRKRGEKWGGKMSRAAAAALFALVSGGFLFGHLLFIFILIFPNDANFLHIINNDFDEGAMILYRLKLSVCAIALSHLASFAKNFVQKKEYLKVNPSEQMSKFFPRVYLPHFSLLIIGFLVIGNTSGIISDQPFNPVWIAIVFVAVKTVIDVIAHIKSHQMQ